MFTGTATVCERRDALHCCLRSGQTRVPASDFWGCFNADALPVAGSIMLVVSLWQHVNLGETR